MPVALSTIAKYYAFRIDNGEHMIMVSVDYPEFGSEAVIRYCSPDNPREVLKRHILSINDHTFTLVN